MPERLTLTGISKVFTGFLNSVNYNPSEDQTIIFYDLDYLKNRSGLLKKLFPRETIHTAAVKANPLIDSIKFFKGLGLGAEAASIGELYIALKCGIKPDKIVFDSPVKTESEIEFALKAGVYINADSFAELDRIERLIKKIKSKSRVGIRINPQVGVSKIKMSSVAGKYSKFGVPIKEFKNELFERFAKHKWLTGVHLHVGSQGCSIDMLIKGIEIVYKFAEDTNAKLAERGILNRIHYFDIGGGLPVAYSGKNNDASMKKYAGKIKSSFPKLFNGEYKIITEFGRWMNANAGWTASRIEYVKRYKGVNTVMIHAGADLFLRRAYYPKLWHHDIDIVDGMGKKKTGKADKNKYVVAGPLCFAGDVIAKDIPLPRAEEGDFIIVHDTGAYTLSMWSRYNSRLIPKVVGYRFSGKINYNIMKKKELVNDLFEFWK